MFHCDSLCNWCFTYRPQDNLLSFEKFYKVSGISCVFTVTTFDYNVDAYGYCKSFLVLWLVCLYYRKIWWWHQNWPNCKRDCQASLWKQRNTVAGSFRRCPTQTQWQGLGNSQVGSSHCFMGRDSSCCFIVRSQFFNYFISLNDFCFSVRHVLFLESFLFCACDIVMIVVMC